MCDTRSRRTTSTTWRRRQGRLPPPTCAFASGIGCSMIRVRCRGCGRSCRCVPSLRRRSAVQRTRPRDVGRRGGSQSRWHNRAGRSRRPTGGRLRGGGGRAWCHRCGSPPRALPAASRTVGHVSSNPESGDGATVPSSELRRDRCSLMSAGSAIGLSGLFERAPPDRCSGAALRGARLRASSP